MASEDINNIVLTGNLTKDPEVRQVGQGDRQQALCTFRIAVNRRPPRGGGQGKADFLDIKVFGPAGENVGRILAKGRRVAVVGRLQIDEVDRTDGNGKAYFTSVVADSVKFLDAPPGDGNGGGGQPASEPKSDIPF